MNLDNNAINLRTIDVYGRYGLICRFDANAPGLDQAIHRIVFELGAEENPRPDFGFNDKQRALCEETLTNR